MGRLEGRVAIVTGGGSGIGRASALALAREGAAVLVADLSGERAEQVAREIGAAGGRAQAHAADVADEAAVAAMVAAAVACFGGLDVRNDAVRAGDLRTIPFERLACCVGCTRVTGERRTDACADDEAVREGLRPT